MGDVKKSDIEIVTGAFEKFLQKSIEEQNFDLKMLTEFMEPKFAEAGYRENKMGGGTDKLNILIIHDVMAGDFISTSGAMREIRRIYPDAYITCVVRPLAFNLAECCPYIDEIVLNNRQYNWGSFVQIYQENISFAAQLLERRFDICFSFAHTLIGVTLMYMSGAKIRVTHQFKDDKEEWGYKADVSLRQVISFLATHGCPIYKYGSHIVDANLALVDCLLQAPVSNREIEVWYTPADVAVAKYFLRNASAPIYAVCMGSMAMHKNYPPEKYARVIELIAQEEPTATFVILGAGDKDLSFAQIIQKTIPQIYEKNVLDLTNKTNFRVSIAILNFCAAYIGNDTGTMHAAVAIKCPILEVHYFPADLPESYTDCIKVFKPYRVPSVVIQPAHALPECAVNEPYSWGGCRVVPQSHCISQIEPETVFKGFKMLKERVAQKINEPFYIH